MLYFRLIKQRRKKKQHEWTHTLQKFTAEMVQFLYSIFIALLLLLLICLSNEKRPFTTIINTFIIYFALVENIYCADWFRSVRVMVLFFHFPKCGLCFIWRTTLQSDFWMGLISTRTHPSIHTHSPKNKTLYRYIFVVYQLDICFSFLMLLLCGSIYTFDFVVCVFVQFVDNFFFLFEKQFNKFSVQNYSFGFFSHKIFTFNYFIAWKRKTFLL